MSFLNISKKMDNEPKKFVPKEVKCPYCSEEGLKLKFAGRSESGRIQFRDLHTNEIHQCKPKYIGYRCKFCGAENLKWVKSPDVKSGNELVDRNGKLHNCRNRNVSDYASLWSHFFDKVVIWEDDPPETIRAKQVLQKKMRYDFPEISEELKTKYKKQEEDWLRHNFMDFVNCQCEQCDYRRNNPPVKKFEVKRRK